ncbi:methyltransferase domain-containing protein [Streptomyces sp. NPDC087849]|uniref:methyltransferase domain-containing protein n=1 Tax=Streptomyces sp. NPDC087849 TaxID=3365808 RepID=UPI0037F5C560
MSGTASGTDPALAERTTQTAARRHPQTLVVWPAQLNAQTLSADRLGTAEPGEPWTDTPYAHALRTGRGPLFLRRLSPPAHPGGAGREGKLLPLDVEHWCAVPDAADTGVLHRCTGPVLDVGCGPGRLVAALAARGLRALGVDVSPAAVARTRQRGGTAVRRSVFDRLPGEGRWDTVLLMDGTVGIGDDPVALLGRLRAVVVSGARLPAEADSRDADERLNVRVEDGHGRHGRASPRSRLGATALLHAAEAAGWTLTGRWTAEGRPFMGLHRPQPVHHDKHVTVTGRPGHP